MQQLLDLYLNKYSDTLRSAIIVTIGLYQLWLFALNYKIIITTINIQLHLYPTEAIHQRNKSVLYKS